MMIFKSLYYSFFPKFIIKKSFSTNINYFGFLIHLGEISDIKVKYKIMKLFPNFIISIIIKFFPPIIISRIEGKNFLNGRLVGFIILCPITAKQMLDHRNYAIKKIEKAMSFADKIGLKIIGLGAYTSSITNGGQDLVEKFNVAITNGNANTTSVIIKDINRITKDIMKTNINNLSIAIVGASGSIGIAVSKLLASYLPRCLILIGRSFDKLNKIRLDINQSVNLVLSNKIQDINNADLIIVATSASGSIIKSNYIKKEAIIYDITQPRNVDKLLCKERPDILVLDGGLVRTKNINYDFNFYLPDDITFACLAEVIILTIKEFFINFSCGNVTLDKVKMIDKLSTEVGFSPPPFYSFGRIIKNNKI